MFKKKRAWNTREQSIVSMTNEAVVHKNAQRESYGGKPMTYAEEQEYRKEVTKHFDENVGIDGGSC